MFPILKKEPKKLILSKQDFKIKEITQNKSMMPKIKANVRA